MILAPELSHHRDRTPAATSSRVEVRHAWPSERAIAGPRLWKLEGLRAADARAVIRVGNEHAGGALQRPSLEAGIAQAVCEEHVRPPRSQIPQRFFDAECLDRPRVTAIGERERSGSWRRTALVPEPDVVPAFGERRDDQLQVCRKAANRATGLRQDGDAHGSSAARRSAVMVWSSAKR